MSKLAVATNTLYEATVAKFGAEALEKAGVSKQSFPPVFPVLPLDQLKVKVTGDRATLSVEGGQPLPLSLVRTGGVWKLNGDDLLPPFSEAELKQQGDIVTAGIAAIEQTKSDLNSTVLRSPDEVVVLMQHRIQRAFQSAQMEQIQQSAGNPVTQPAGGK
jgi:hypothetical protein